MRTPNVKCIICETPLYRRPSELKQYRFVCCKKCRGEAYKKYPSETSLKNLELGREKGTNHLGGIPHIQSHKDLMSVKMTKWCKENPEKVKERGLKIRGEGNWQWKGGSSKLNTSIRTMTEHKKWMDAVKERDVVCVRCGSNIELESHHLIELADILKIYKIKNREQARICKDLWDIDNGITLCSPCHCKEHKRKYSPKLTGRRHDNRRNIV